jgi:hypothetical protein
MLYIFDLDGTAIDSSHRANTLADGSLNLAAWRENSTPEMIARDSLLPLGEQWRDMVARGLDGTNVQIAIITARVMGAADLQYLDDNGLAYDYIYSRNEGDHMPDDMLKKIMLHRLARDMGRSMKWLQNFAWFYDDNLGVIEMGCDLGISMVNSTLYNKKAL